MNARRGITALHAAVVMLLGAIAGGVQASGGSPLPYARIDFEYTGTVYDAATKQPIEGAYVVAIYREQVVSVAAMNSQCVKTRGMYTGKDGKFHFPVEDLRGNSPLYARAIKPGYFNGSDVFPPPEVWKKQGREAYTGRDVYLNLQVPGKPEFAFGTGEEYCTHAKTRGDAAAGLEFLKMELDEFNRLGADAQTIRATQKMIQRLESLPETAPERPAPVVDAIK